LGGEVLNEKQYTVADLAPVAKRKFIYEYDFGDSWEHEVLVERVLPPAPAFRHPLCLAGTNACPPEDCGGIYGYYELLVALANPKHEQHQEMKEWVGGKWDASRFDLETTNTRLKRLKA
jgi:Plasmid pRiA4b ORF-3-like protein